jgi:hypothetical protein
MRPILEDISLYGLEKGEKSCPSAVTSRRRDLVPQKAALVSVPKFIAQSKNPPTGPGLILPLEAHDVASCPPKEKTDFAFALSFFCSP